MKLQIPGSCIYTAEEVITGRRIRQRQESIGTHSSPYLRFCQARQYKSFYTSADRFRICPDDRFKYVFAIAGSDDRSARIEVYPQAVHNARGKCRMDIKFKTGLLGRRSG